MPTNTIQKLKPKTHQIKEHQKKKKKKKKRSTIKNTGNQKTSKENVNIEDNIKSSTFTLPDSTFRENSCCT